MSHDDDYSEGLEEEEEDMLDEESVEEEDGQEEDEENDEEEDEENMKEEEEVFKEEMPAAKEEVLEFQMLLPGKGPGKQQVLVNLSRSPQPFSRAYRKSLVIVKRENILKQLEGDRSAMQRFFDWEQRRKEAADEESTEEEEEEFDEDGNTYPRFPYPYWLPYLLANDMPFLERTCRAMYGWAVPPPPPVPVSHSSEEQTSGHAMRRSSKSARGAVSFQTDDSDEEEEEEEEEEEQQMETPKQREEEAANVRDPAHPGDSYFLSSNAFSGDGSMPEVQRTASTPSLGRGETQPPSTVSTPRTSEADDASKTPIPAAPEPSNAALNFQQQMEPLTSLPSFEGANQPLYIVWDRNGEEWNLIDLHPVLFMHRKRLEVQEQLAKRARDAEERDEDDRNDTPADGDEEEEDESDEVDDEGDEEEDEADDVPDYDVDGMITIDALTLAALYSPSLLRIILMQKDAPSLAVVQSWMEKDLTVGFAVLSSIYVALLAVRKEWGRLPYRISQMRLNFSIFFSHEYVFSTASADHRLLGSHSSRSPDDVGKQVDDIASPRSADAMFTMKALLRAGFLPEHPISRALLTTPESLQLALWLCMSIPKSLVVSWGRMALQPPLPQSPNAEEEEEASEADEDEESATESMLMERIQREDKKAKVLADQQAVVMNGTLQDPYISSASTTPSMQISSYFLPAPLLLNTMLEVRRRVARDVSGKQPSILALRDTISKYYVVSQIEDGKRNGDPIVTAQLQLIADTPLVSVDLPAPSLESGGVKNRDYTEETPVVANTATPGRARHQRVFQTDLLLLLLALTTTQLPLSPTTLEGPSKGPASANTMCVIRRHRDQRSNSVHDGHAAFFTDLLREKLGRIQSPLMRARAATCWLLLAIMPRYKVTQTFAEVCAAMPLYQLLGCNERAPLGNLVYTWCHEARELRDRHLDIFINTFWQEIYYRIKGSLYPPSTLEYIRTKMGTLLDKTEERVNYYRSQVTALGNKRPGKSFGLQSSPMWLALETTSSSTGSSATPPAVVAANSPNSSDLPITNQQFSAAAISPLNQALEISRADSFSSGSPLKRALHLNKKAAQTGTVTLMYPNPHSKEVQKGESSIAALLDSLPMTPRTIFTPELLYTILFANREVDPIVVRYVMLTKGVSTVRKNGPYKGTEVSALEYAICTHNTKVAKLLVGLGASLEDPVEQGALTMEVLAQRGLESEDACEVQLLAQMNKQTVRTDPGQHFGILRVIADAYQD